MSLKEYKPGSPFPGKIGRTIDESEPAWPAQRRAKDGAPNVLFIVLDDTGFGQLGCYGSSINTPNLDSLAEGGLLYTNMHTTGLCSPTRTCILTGRNHHSNNMASVADNSTGFPGYNGYVPFENGFLSEILLEHGYNTYILGKWHLTPLQEVSATGPYDRWPLGRGFERFYGFMGGDTNQYYPELVYDNHYVITLPRTPEEGYTLNEDLADRAIQFIANTKQIDPNKPFFLYHCLGATHAPHHVPKEWTDKYKGKFDDGWEAYREKTFARQKELGIIPKNAKLSPHDPDVPHWDECSPDEKKIYSRMMEVYAGFLEQTDYHIGRIIRFLKEAGEFENTLIMVISDNGASAEGGPTGTINENQFFNNVPGLMGEVLENLDKLGGPETFSHYAWGWAWAGDTPFRRWKRETYRGGVSDPFIVHWPRGIKAKGDIRNQYAHAIDMVPTVLDCLGIEAPLSIKGITQSAIEGVSFAHTFDNADAPTKHHTQYFEMIGNRALYHNGWRAVCPWPGPSFAEAEYVFGSPITADMLVELDAKGWELYHVEKDWTETENVAEENRPKLIEMITTWYTEAGKYNVLPIDSRMVQRLNEERPSVALDRSVYTYYPGTDPVILSAAVNVLNRTHIITAHVDIPEGGAEGVLLADGSIGGGYSFYIKDGKLHWAHNYVARTIYHLESSENVPEGRHELSFEFKVTGKPNLVRGEGAPGIAKLFIDEKSVGTKEVPVTIPITLGITSGLTCGSAPASPITPDYKPPFKFTGKIFKVTVDVSGKLYEDKEAEMRMIMTRQ
jgi:arylsulfatase